jgi:hypothetical protein
MKDNELRGVILEKFYEMRRKEDFEPKPNDFNPPMPPEDLYRICDQLYEHGLIHWHVIKSKDGCHGCSGKITAHGVDIVEKEGKNSPINIVITSNIYNQSFIFDIEQLIIKLNNIDASDEEKHEAKSRLRSFIEHPLVTSIVGGILGNLPSLLK